MRLTALLQSGLRTEPVPRMYLSYYILRTLEFSIFQQVNESPEALKYLWYPELEIYGLETFSRQKVLKEMSGVRIMKNKTINYELK